MSAIGSILSNDGALKALNSLRNSSNTTNNLEAQLSSGKKINSPADNPAGYITAEGFTSQLNGLNQALSNANQGISLLQTAQGAIGQQTSLLQKMNSIAVQASNGTQTPSESQSLQNVVGQLTSQVNNIASQTQFNNINLLNGNFSGVSFQTGANNGQTTTLSIAGTSANDLGMNASQVKASGMYTSNSSGSSSAAVTLGTTGGSKQGAFTGSSGTGGPVTIKGSNGSATVKVAKANTSAASIASEVNANTDKTNVSAQAKTQVTLANIGSSTHYSINLGNGSAGSVTNSVSISAQGRTAFVNAVNNHTAETGISAKDSSGNVVLTQANGKNIAIQNTSSSTAIKTANGASITGTSGSSSAATIQGKVTFQSDAGFALGSNASNIGLQQKSNLSALSGINVSTTSGAQKAINVIKYSLQKLGAEGGKLGAVQQRLQANVNNNQTTTQNLTSARSVVQDANIPKVSQQLTQQQVLQQAGISALKNSTTLQQQYQRLLP